jgi:hypothetical protein
MGHSWTWYMIAYKKNIYYLYKCILYWYNNIILCFIIAVCKYYLSILIFKYHDDDDKGIKSSLVILRMFYV